MIKTFLQIKLGVSEDNAEKDACKMEHVLSDETFEKLKTFLNSDSGKT
jgi:DtxR family Mn-dependent transcriptional regulator